MTLLEFVTALGPSGLGVGILSFGGLVLKMTAWRLRARDLREHQARLESATTAEQRALIASVPPPDFGDQVLKVLVVALLSGMALACSEPAYRLATIARLGPASLCRPACQRGERCEGRICTRDARPTPAASDTMTSAAPPQPSPPPPPKPPGPQSSLDALASRRWTDGHDPFEIDPAL